MGGAEGVWGAGGRGGGVHGWGGEARKLEGLGIVNHWVEMRSGGQGCLWGRFWGEAGGVWGPLRRKGLGESWCNAGHMAGA